MENKSSVVEDIPKGLEDEEYFHGLLPREDCNEILTEIGDFLVRVSQPRPTDPREVIISVRISKEQTPHAVRHVIIKKQKIPKEGVVWIAIEAIKFPSFFDLIEHYMKKGNPINPDVESSVLVTGVKRKSWEFTHEDVKLKKVLGAGAFGEVRSGEITINKKKIECAVKIAKLTVTEAQMAFRKEKIKEMMHEARLMRHYEHDNVVRFYGVAVDREPLMIVIELIKGGCLSEDLKQRKGNITDDEKVEKMCLGAARGIQYLHSKKCIHRDIAARNVLYTKDKVAKISDFGMSREGGIYKMKTCKKVPIKWTAPETIATFIYSLKTDVYSFSILVTSGKRMDIPDAPEGIATLIEHCWAQDPATRWSMSDAVKQLENVVLIKQSLKAVKQLEKVVIKAMNQPSGAAAAESAKHPTVRHKHTAVEANSVKGNSVKHSLQSIKHSVSAILNPHPSPHATHKLKASKMKKRKHKS